jgi:hypothetical protein
LIAAALARAADAPVAADPEAAAPTLAFLGQRMRQASGH